MPEKTISLDQIMSERGFSTRSKGDGLIKIQKSPASWNSENRSAKFTMTAEVVDRYGDIVVTKGGDTTEFEKNPVALWAHDSRDFPIGMWSDIKKISGTPKRMEGLVTLTAEETTDEADTVAKLLAQNMVRACSIGFMPKAWEVMRDDKERFMGYKFLEWELLECSVCSIPANPAALVKAAGGDESLARQAIELVLDSWARTPTGLIVSRADYERAYEVVADEKVTLHEVKSFDEDADEDPDAAAPVLNNLDIEAAVARGISSVMDGVIAKVASIFGKTVPVADKQETKPVDEDAEDKSAGGDEEGMESEEQFQARIAAEAAAEPELADEAEELELRSRAAEIA